MINFTYFSRLVVFLGARLEGIGLKFRTESSLSSKATAEEIGIEMKKSLHSRSC